MKVVFYYFLFAKYLPRHRRLEKVAILCVGHFESASYFCTQIPQNLSVLQSLVCSEIDPK